MTLALHFVMAGGERARPRGSGGAAAQPHRARRAGLAGRKAALRLARRSEGARPGGLRQGRARAQGRAHHRHDMVRMPMSCGVRTCPVPLDATYILVWMLRAQRPAHHRHDMVRRRAARSVCPAASASAVHLLHSSPAGGRQLCRRELAAGSERVNECNAVIVLVPCRRDAHQSLLVTRMRVSAQQADPKRSAACVLLEEHVLHKRYVCLAATDTCRQQNRHPRLLHLQTHDILKAAPATAHALSGAMSLECWGGATFDGGPPAVFSTPTGPTTSCLDA